MSNAHFPEHRAILAEIEADARDAEELTDEEEAEEIARREAEAADREAADWVARGLWS